MKKSRNKIILKQGFNLTLNHEYSNLSISQNRPMKFLWVNNKVINQFKISKLTQIKKKLLTKTKTMLTILKFHNDNKQKSLIKHQNNIKNLLQQWPNPPKYSDLFHIIISRRLLNKIISFNLSLYCRNYNQLCKI